MKRFQLIIDAHNCDEKLLSDKAFIEAFISEVATTIEMKILYGPVIVEGIPQNPGLTGFAVIDFSHISIHTYTETKEFNLDVFSCKEFNTKDLISYVKQEFRLADKDVKVKTLRNL